MALFVAAIDAGSLSGAARKGGVSLSTVSRQVTALEERVGTRLLVRTTRALALTEAGRNYYERAKQLLVDIDELETSLTTDAAAPSGHLTVSGPTLFGRVFILPILSDFAMRYPDITLDVLLLDRPVNLVEEGVDLAIRIYDLDDSSLMVRRLGNLRWVVSAAPDYLAARGTPNSPEELLDHDCLLFYDESRTPAWPILIDGKPGRTDIHVRASSNTLDGVVALALAGAGLVYAPAWSVAHHVAEGRLKVVMRDCELPPRPINAVFTHNRLLSGKVRALLDCLVEEISNYELDTIPAFGSRTSA
ncbi:MAG: LysR family transcriptional regulator [Alphaproteobacteria bacterium]|nr:LysR family transcriptional regulator [Alphaproteobacteria bacterium]